MPEVVASHGVLPPANLAPIVNNIGAGAPDLSEQRLKPCENGNVTNDEAQRAVDDLDRVNSNLVFRTNLLTPRTGFEREA